MLLEISLLFDWRNQKAYLSECFALIGKYFSEVLKAIITFQKRIVNKPDIVTTRVRFHFKSGVEMG
jgi:hypothetical protein